MLTKEQVTRQTKLDHHATAGQAHFLCPLMGGTRLGACPPAWHDCPRHRDPSPAELRACWREVAEALK